MQYDQYEDDDKILYIKECISNLPEIHELVLYDVVSMLLEITELEDVNLMDSKNCGIIFGPTLMDSVEDPQLQLTIARKQASLVSLMIENFDVIFQGYSKDIITAKIKTLAPPSVNVIPEFIASKSPSMLVRRRKKQHSIHNVFRIGGSQDNNIRTAITMTLFSPKSDDEDEESLSLIDQFEHLINTTISSSRSDREGILDIFVSSELNSSLMGSAQIKEFYLRVVENCVKYTLGACRLDLSILDTVIINEEEYNVVDCFNWIYIIVMGIYDACHDDINKYMGQLFQDIAMTFAEMFRDQIELLKPDGTLLFADCITDNIFVILSDTIQNEYESPEGFINILVKQIVHTTNVDEDTLLDSYTDPGLTYLNILQRTGIKTHDGKYYEDDTRSPELYGYRWGTKNEAKKLGLKLLKEYQQVEEHTHNKIIALQDSLLQEMKHRRMLELKVSTLENHLETAMEMIHALMENTY
eukprot:TRINITY_DN5467_c0_g2_i1.p1 TRINITY_DN5467_c0_g2~~TRINITY_DN5467_c0_g2_i1.p1  ORF type:complete len:470 (-),score=92.66 TRINITY_DN5467_c0_g2_i1:1189-2598(-)